jgi:spore germination protein GerM
VETEPEAPAEEERRDAEGREEPADEIRVEERSAEEEEEEAPEGEEPRIDKKMRKSPLYFVSVGDDGSITLRRIVRPVYYESSPLTMTLKALLQGLTSSELNEGLLNLIPEETEIRQVWVEDGIAYIDFSEELKFNPFGTEGLRASLRQIVYTATEFSTVNRVQILIGGSKHSYLSTEGVYIGEPLGRGDL